MFSQGARQAGAGIPAASSATQAQAIAVSRRPHEVLVRTFYELCEAIVVAVRHQCSDREGSDDANKGSVLWIGWHCSAFALWVPSLRLQEEPSRLGPEGRCSHWAYL